MIKTLYSVYDIKAVFYGMPFEAKSDGDAARMFSGACKDQSSMLGQYPSDFQLFKVGSFDDHAGQMSSITPVFIMSGSEVFANADIQPVQSAAQKSR